MLYKNYIILYSLYDDMKKISEKISNIFSDICYKFFW